MIKAKLAVGFMTIDCEGDTPSEVFLQAERVQDFDCLINMACMYGEEDKAVEFRDEYVIPAREGTLTLDRLKKMNIEFEPGAFVCLEAYSDDPE